MISELMDKYDEAIKVLEDSSPDSESVLAALLTRSTIDKAIADEGITSESFEKLVKTDDRLRKEAGSRFEMDWESWREVYRPDSGHWWWFIDQTHLLDIEAANRPWIIVASVLVAISIALAVEVARRVWATDQSFLAASGVLLTGLVSTGSLTKYGRSVTNCVMSRIGTRRTPIRITVIPAVAALLVTVGFWVFVGKCLLPQMAVDYNNRADEQLQAGNLTAAQRNYERAISINPQYAAGYRNLASAYIEMAEYDYATTLYHKALAADRTLDLTYNDLGHVLIRQGKPQEAVAVLYAGLNLAEDDVVRAALWTNISWAYLELGRKFEASEAVKTALGLRPDDQVPNCLQALVGEELHMPEHEVRIAWERCLGYIGNQPTPREMELAALARAHLVTPTPSQTSADVGETAFGDILTLTSNPLSSSVSKTPRITLSATVSSTQTDKSRTISTRRPTSNFTATRMCTITTTSTATCTDTATVTVTPEPTNTITATPTNTSLPVATPDLPVAGHLLLELDGELRYKCPGWNQFLPLSFGKMIQSGTLLDPNSSGTGLVVCANLETRRIDYYSSTCLCEDSQRILMRGPSLMQAPQRTVNNQQVGMIPYILRPRNTSVLDPQPLIAWNHPISQNITYTVRVWNYDFGWEWEAQDGQSQYPLDAPALQPGTTYYLKVTSFYNRTSDEEDPGMIIGFNLLTPERTATIESLVREARALGFDDIATRFLVAEIYASYHLRSDAIAELQQLSMDVDQPQPVFFQRLGDLYLEVGLYEQAIEAYISAEVGYAQLGDVAAQAEAYIGLGRAYFGTQRVDDVQAVMMEAERLYGELGDTERVEYIKANLLSMGIRQ